MSENIRGNFLTPTVWWRFVRETRVYWCSDLVRHFERSVAVFAGSEIVPLRVCISWIATVSLRLRSWLRDTSRTLCASYSPIMKLVCSISWWDFWPAPCRVLELRSLNRYDARPSRSVRKLARSYGAHHFLFAQMDFDFCCDTISARTDVEHSLSLARLPGTHWVTICAIRRLALTVSDACSRLVCFQSASTYSAFI